MEDKSKGKCKSKSKNCVPELPRFASKPPVCPKSFAMVPPSIVLPMAPGSYQGSQQPYFMNHGMGASSSGTKHNNLENSNKIIEIPPPLSRNPITSVEPSSTKNGGIVVKTEQGIDYEMKWGRIVDPNMDTKRLRRILSNRISAQKTRMRKAQYAKDLEKAMKDLQADIAVLNPRIESETENYKLLQMENGTLKQKMSVCEEKVKISLAKFKEYQATIKELKELYFAQQKMQMQLEGRWTPSWNNKGFERTANSSSRGVGPQPPMEDPALSFLSLIVDPPKSLI
ncbi:unnamed protein product [Camellia sinensis]